MKKITLIGSEKGTNAADCLSMTAAGIGVLRARPTIPDSGDLDRVFPGMTVLSGRIDENKSNAASSIVICDIHFDSLASYISK